MTNFARSLAGAGARSRAGATRVSLAAVLGCLLALVFTAPAAAVVTEVGGTSVGLEPRMGNTIVEEGRFEVTPGKGETEIEGAQTFSNANGNAVLHGTNVYPIYWDPKTRSSPITNG